MKRAVPYLLCVAVGAMLGFSVALFWRLDFMAQKQELREREAACMSWGAGIHLELLECEADKRAAMKL